MNTTALKSLFRVLTPAAAPAQAGQTQVPQAAAAVRELDRGELRVVGGGVAALPKRGW